MNRENWSRVGPQNTGPYAWVVQVVLIALLAILVGLWVWFS